MIKKSAKLKTALSGYLLCSLFIFLSFVAVHMFYKKTGSLAEFISRQYNYNSILCLTASVFLFLTFQNIRISEGRVADWICKAATASFGVYLIHEHIDMRYLWPVWLGVESFANTPVFIVHWLPGIVAVYAVCMLIDFARRFVFQKLEIIYRKVL